MNESKNEVVNSDNESSKSNSVDPFEFLYKPFCVEKGGFLYEEKVPIPGQKDVDIKIKIPPKPTLAHEIEMWDTINKFELNAWSSSNVGLKTGWKCLDNAFDNGLKPGFIVIAGDSNLGKQW